jgi:MFS transporter, putative metabolite:H+ symporter
MEAAAGSIAMGDLIDRSPKLTRNQWHSIVVVSVVGLIEFFDQFIIGFVLAFMSQAWHLTYGISAIILLASGVGAIIGAMFWGRLADRFGRKPGLFAVLATFTICSLLLTFTPEGNWVYLAVFRTGIGVGIGGYVINVALLQEVIPARRRGLITGISSICIPLGLLLGSSVGAYLAPTIGWRGMFSLGAVLGVVCMALVWTISESPRWALTVGRPELARAAMAWLLQRPSDAKHLELMQPKTVQKQSIFELFRYRRSIAAAFLINVGGLTAYYGLILWAPTLLVLIQGVSPAEASKFMIGVSLAGIAGRALFSFLSELIGRRVSGAIYTFVGAGFLVAMGAVASGAFGNKSEFAALLTVGFLFIDGGFAISASYSTEMWPSHLRATGGGFAYASGSIGRITGPLGLALLIGSSDFIRPTVSLTTVYSAFVYLAGWFALVGIAYLFVGPETQARTFAEIDSGAAADQPGQAA